MCGDERYQLRNSWTVVVASLCTTKVVKATRNARAIVAGALNSTTSRSRPSSCIRGGAYRSRWRGL